VIVELATWLLNMYGPAPTGWMAKFLPYLARAAGDTIIPARSARM
jgi:hypothetical protein